MSLARFANKDIIRSFDGAMLANKWTEKIVDKKILQQLPHTIDANTEVEVHLYSKGNTNTYIDSVYDIPWSVADDAKMSINLSAIATQVDLLAGKFHIIYNFHNNKVGTVDNPGFYIEEISPDRTEIYIRSVIGSNQQIKNAREQYLNNLSTAIDLKDGNLVINFGRGEVYTIIQQGSWTHSDGLRLKLLKPLRNNVIEGQTTWISKETADPIADDIEFVTKEVSDLFRIRQANFDVETEYSTITETDFKNWNDLLGSNLSTSQQIVDTLFSGSLSGIDLGIDYSNFENFVHFSSAKERIANFKYKLKLVEFYNQQLSQLEDVLGDNTGSLQNSVTLNRNRKDQVIGTFDGFEHWLYTESTSSLFTHQTIYDTDEYKQNQLRLEGGYLGADTYQLTPFPKYISGSHGTGTYRLHHSTSSLGAAWFTGFESSASFFDNENNNALVRTIPEHIRIDTNNDQYELFVNMIGHHFDILYSYADTLAKTYHPIEHPKLGHSKETLFQVAKSLGWTLINGKQASSLWQYKLGVNSTGSYQSTGSIFSKTDEDITTEVWRRIVNNLPYLLKTKGTERSVKALMNTYGIPQTLLSIREYGGPKVAGDVPTLIEDRFSYALKFNNGAHVKFINTYYSSSIGDWGIDQGLVPTRTHQFRIKPYSGSSMFIASNVSSSGENTWVLALQHTGSYSGSGNYGRLHFALNESNNGGTGSFTDYVPIFDGNFWNIQLSVSDKCTGSNAARSFTVRTQQASDYITGKVIHSASLSITPGKDNDAHNRWANKGDSQEILLGLTGSNDLSNTLAILSCSFGVPAASGSSFVVTNTTGNAGTLPTSCFSGSMQEYRGWLEEIDQTTFNLHTLNPTSYVSSLSPTGSYDTLIRHYPFGTDLNAVDHSAAAGNAGTIISSSHPNQSIKDFSPAFPTSISSSTYATASGFETPSNSQRGNYEPVEETYYIQGISLGGNNPRSQKIRFDDNTLVRQLSPTNTAERSRFDFAPIDSPKLGLFYSMADQINKDIYNHVGDVELDDYIGDPDDEYEMDYSDLTHFSKKYWKKYTNRNDINAYMRIFSQFDFGLFHQIKQLLPERVDEATGLLVEPNALERSKVRLTKKPSHESMHYEATLPTPKPDSSGEYNTYTGDIIVPAASASGDNVFSVTNNYSAVLSTFGSGSPDYFLKEVFPVDAAPTINSGSKIAAYTVINTIPDITGNVSQSVHWTGWAPGNLDSGEGSIVSAVALTGSTGLVHTDFVRVQFNTYCRYDTIKDLHIDIRHRDSQGGGYAEAHCKLLTTPNNIHGEHPAYYDGKRHIVSESGEFVGRTLKDNKHIDFRYSGANFRLDRFTFKDVHVQERTNVTAEIYWKWKPGQQITLRLDQVMMHESMKKTGYSALIPYFNTPRPSYIFKKKIYHFSTGSVSLGKYEKNWNFAQSQSRLDWYSSSLADVGYRDDEYVQLDNLRFNGTRISAPAINANSGYSGIGYRPLIQVWQVNPNQIAYTANPDASLNTFNPSNVMIIGSGPTIPDAPPTIGRTYN